MFTVIKPTHNFLGRIPELNCVLLRDCRTGQLELWKESKGLSVRTIILQGVELEFERKVESAWRVIDVDYNRDNYLDDIGRIYIDTPPAQVVVKEL